MLSLSLSAPRVPLFEIGLVDAPHADVADPKLFESAVRAGLAGHILRIGQCSKAH